MSLDEEETVDRIPPAPGRGDDPGETTRSGPSASVFEIFLDDAPPEVSRTSDLPGAVLPRAAGEGGSWHHPDLSPGERIGRGGQGEVWEALQVSLGRTIAVKRLLDRPAAPGSASVAESQRERDLFVREAVTAARLQHPNIVPVHDLKKTEDGSHLLVMKRLKGRAWKEVLEEDRSSMDEADFLARHLGVLVSVTQAVAYAHEQGVIHRDLKPAQVVLGSFGEVSLLDWGLAASFRSSPEGDWIATPAAASDNPAGTPCFMAPEQAIDSPAGLGPRTDVYLLGGILYQVVAGVRPHEGASIEEVLGQARRGEIEPPAPGCNPPADLLELALHALSPRPADRPASAREFLARLESIVSGASRRKEAREIAASAKALLAEAGSGPGLYSRLPALGADLQRAAAMAPGDGEVAAVRDSVAERLAEEALRAGDLGLAGFAAEGVSDEARSLSLRADVSRALETRRREARQRRIALVSAIVLLVLGLAGALAFLFVERRLSARAERQKERAQVLAGYLVDSFAGRLEETGRGDLLAGVTEPVVRHYASEPPSSLSAVEVLEYARALRLSAQALAAQEDATEALRRASLAVDLLAGVGEERLGREGLLRLSRAWRTRSAIEARLGALDEALGEAEKAVALSARLSKAEPGAADLALEEASARADLLVRLWAVGRNGRVAAEEEGAEAAVGRAVALAPSDLASRELAIRLAVGRSVYASLGGRPAEALSLAEEARALGAAIADRFPGSARPQAALAAALGAKAMALADTDPPASVDAAQGAVAAAGAARALDSSSTIHRLGEAVALNRLGYALLKAGRSREAAAPLERARGELDALVAADSRRMPRLLARGLTLRLLAWVAWQSGDRLRAVALVSESRAGLERAAELARESVEAAIRSANASLDEAEMLAAVGRSPEVPQLLATALARLEPFFQGRRPGHEARVARARLLEALGRRGEARTVLAAGPGEAGPIPEETLAPTGLAVSGLRVAFF